MSLPVVIVVASFITLALAHSWIGEKRLLRPLLARRPWQAYPQSEAFAAGTLRMAWHITSLTWLGMAASVALVPDAPALLACTAAVLLGCGALAHAFSAGRHGAWLVFWVGGVAALWQVGLPALAPAVVGALCAAVLALLGALHVAWALGWQWGLSAALPVGNNGTPLFRPGPAITLAVALALGVAASLVGAAAGLWALPLPDGAVRALLGVGCGVFFLRALGDFRTAGITRRWSASTFVLWDALLFTPLCAGLALGFATVLVGAR